MSTAMRAVAGSWLRRWEILTVATFHLLLIAILTLAGLQHRDVTDLDLQHTPFGPFFFLPCALGFRLRDMLGDETLALAPSHSSSHLRFFFAILLPLTIITTAVPLSLLGASVLEATAISCAFGILGAWLGFNHLRPLPIVIFLAFCFALWRFHPTPGPAATIQQCAVLVLVISGSLAAWRHLAQHPPRPLKPMDLFSGWFPSRSLRITDLPRRLPTLGTVLRLELALQRASWLQRLQSLLVCVLTTAGTLLLNNDPVLLVFTLFAISLAGPFLTPFIRTMTNQKAQRNGAIALERLRPLSRRDAAASSLLSILVAGLGTAVICGGGVLLGGVAFALWRGIPAGLLAGAWWLVPGAAISAACGTAVAGLYLTLPRWLGVSLVILLGATLTLGPVFLPEHRGPLSGVVVLASCLLVPVILVPLAWRRLADAELP